MAKSKWPTVQARLAEVRTWLKSGLTEKQVCRNLGIGVSTWEGYKKQHPELLKAIKRGRRPLITELENALVKRALGYTYEEVKTAIKVSEDGKEIRSTEKTVKEMPPDVGALAILLKNKAPDRYTNDRALLEFKRQELELQKEIVKAKAW